MNKFQDIIAGDTPVLVDFFAEWCGPCKMIKPVLEELKKKMGNKIIILKIDIDKNISLSSEYRIQSVPTLVLWKQGEIIWRQSGALSLNELEQVLSSYIRLFHKIVTFLYDLYN